MYIYTTPSLGVVDIHIITPNKSKHSMCVHVHGDTLMVLRRASWLWGTMDILSCICVCVLFLSLLRNTNEIKVHGCNKLDMIN